MPRININLNNHRAPISQNNAGTTPPQAEPEQPHAHRVRPNPPSSSRHVPSWLRSVLPSRNQSRGPVSLLDHMAKEMRSAKCRKSLIDHFKRSWAILGNPHPESLYARNLLADLQAHGYSPQHVQSVVNRIKMLEEKTKASLNRQEVEDMTRLQQLYLNGNQLQTLPAEVGQWTAMQKLELNGNHLRTLPVEVGQWAAMQKLELNGNHLRTLPVEVGQWAAMQRLSLYENQLEILPAEVGQWAAMQILNLGSNYLQTLPTEVGQWSAMQKLFLDENQLKTLPTEVGQWAAMQILDLSNNQLKTLPDSIGNLRNLRHLDLSGNRFTRVPDVLFNLPADTEIFLSGNPFPPEEIQRIRDVRRNRQERGLPVPQLVDPRLGPDREINQDNALRDAAEMGMNVHAQGLTVTVRQRIDELAAQFPENLKGDIHAQQTEMRAIQQRLEQALQQYGEKHPSLSIARARAADMFATGLGTRRANYNDFQYSAGHVLSYVFLAIERQWSKTPDTHLKEAHTNAMHRLIDQLVADLLTEGVRRCDTRIIEEVFQLVGMPLSQYAEKHPEIIGAKPVSLSRTEVRELALPAAKRLMAQLLQEPSSSQRSDAQEQQAFLARLTVELCKEDSPITPAQVTAYVTEEIVPAWDEFKEVAAEEHHNRTSSGGEAQIWDWLPGCAIQ